MDPISFEMSRFALNMFESQTKVSAINIANQGVKKEYKVDYKDIVNNMDGLDDKSKLDYLKNLNSHGAMLAETLGNYVGKEIDIKEQSFNSSEASMKYQVLVEAINKKMYLSSLIFGR